MNEADVRERLHAVLTELGVPASVPPPLEIDQAHTDADTQRAAAGHVDQLLDRVAALTGVLGAGQDRQWDDVDRLAAQLLLADLTVVASTTRALNSLAGARLTAARSELVAARHDLERTTEEAG